ncbi:MAG: hypothetical protein L0I62_06665 [Gammaproteobacteria bacterium]|nr:hypothetical protein [Gammaproteobacteria bacterium]
MFGSNLKKAGGVVLAAALLVAAGAANAGGAKVEKTSFGQPPRDSSIVVSPQGQHVAWPGMAGSRVDMVVDGVAGPPFDQLLLQPSGGTVAFSEDGSRYTYFGRTGGEYPLIVDGKEMAHGPYNPSRLGYLAFSPGGKHVYFIESDNGYQVVMDGKPGPQSSTGRLGVVFSADDEHYAYNGPERMNSSQWFSVIDGEKGPFIGNDLQYTPDNRLISIMPKPDGQVLMIDGQPVLKARAIRKIRVAPGGRHILAVVFPEAGGAEVLYVDGKPVKAATNPTNVVFSTDGNHYAATCSAGTGRAFVVIDGEKGREYAAVRNAAFIPGTSRVLYIAGSSQGKEFVVADGKELGPYPQGLVTNQTSQSGIVMSKTDGHYIFASNYDSRSKTQDIVYDGKTLQLHDYKLWGIPPTLSADGTRYAFAVSPWRNVDIVGLLVDGKLQEGVKPRRWRNRLGSPSGIAFSSDGRHIAWEAHSKDPHKRFALFVDGKPVFSDPKGSAWLIRFTPNGRHLYWAWYVANGGRPNEFTLYLDGRAVAQFSRSSLNKLPSAWQMNVDGSVQFLTVGKDGNVLRYRVAPAADTSVETLLGGAATGQATPAIHPNPE